MISFRFLTYTYNHNPHSKNCNKLANIRLSTETYTYNPPEKDNFTRICVQKKSDNLNSIKNPNSKKFILSLYYNYRYYSAELGRWLSRDPIMEYGGFNLYAMVGNDPVDWRDYLGLELRFKSKNIEVKYGNDKNIIRNLTENGRRASGRFDKGLTISSIECTEENCLNITISYKPIAYVKHTKDTSEGFYIQSNRSILRKGSKYGEKPIRYVYYDEHEVNHGLVFVSYIVPQILKVALKQAIKYKSKVDCETAKKNFKKYFDNTLKYWRITEDYEENIYLDEKKEFTRPGYEPYLNYPRRTNAPYIKVKQDENINFNKNFIKPEDRLNNSKEVHNEKVKKLKEKYNPIILDNKE